MLQAQKNASYSFQLKSTKLEPAEDWQLANTPYFTLVLTSNVTFQNIFYLAILDLFCINSD